MNSTGHSPDQFEPDYPTNSVFGVVDQPRDVIDVLSELNEAPVDSENIEVISNEVAEQQLNEFKDERPVEARIVKFLVEFGEEAEEWGKYNRRLQEGRYIIRVPVENDDQAGRVAEILKQHNGYYINYFAPLTITRLAP